jgi:hypothetical protein
VGVRGSSPLSSTDRIDRESPYSIGDSLLPCEESTESAFPGLDPFGVKLEATSKRGHVSAPPFRLPCKAIGRDLVRDPHPSSGEVNVRPVFDWSRRESGLDDVVRDRRRYALCDARSKSPKKDRHSKRSTLIDQRTAPSSPSQKVT